MPNKTNTSELKMHAAADGKLFEFARALRKSMIPAETVMWECIRNKKLGVKFRRQHPIDNFILDFYCHELKLAIEVDGSIHEQYDNKLYDEYRTIQLKEYEIKVIRFTNEDVLNSLNSVLDRIMGFIHNGGIFPLKKEPHPYALLLKGEGHRAS
ncbi:endonuclease domain-containing protein [uncultured Cytophaga sp.]|uniref:endonuclease domain-containing protein n=1 Tax=uncultured Cytophaga sp. TaxID=160238 RepID=UPI00262A4E5E|nr:endonuclease domain-containing protein [uncultured Cytophaga sp.]